MAVSRDDGWEIESSYEDTLAEYIDNGSAFHSKFGPVSGRIVLSFFFFLSLFIYLFSCIFVAKFFESLLNCLRIIRS